MYIPGKDDDETLDGIDPEDLEIDNEDVDSDDEPWTEEDDENEDDEEEGEEEDNEPEDLAAAFRRVQGMDKRILRTQWTIEAKILKGTPMTRRERRIPRMKTETLTTIEDLQLCLEKLITLLSNEA